MLSSLSVQWWLMCDMWYYTYQQEISNMKIWNMHTSAAVIRYIGWIDGLTQNELDTKERNRTIKWICGIMRMPEFHSNACAGLYWVQRRYRTKGNMKIHIFPNGQIVPVHCRSQFSICLYFPSNLLIGFEWHSSRMHRGSVPDGKLFGWKVFFNVLNVQPQTFLFAHSMHANILSTNQLFTQFQYYFASQIVICVTDHNASFKINIFISRIRFHNKQFCDSIFHQINSHREHFIRIVFLFEWHSQFTVDETLCQWGPKTWQT